MSSIPVPRVALERLQIEHLIWNYFYVLNSLQNIISPLFNCESLLNSFRIVEILLFASLLYGELMFILMILMSWLVHLLFKSF